MSKTPRRRVSAFTLVELMVVILIIGVLIGILIPVVASMRRKAQAVDSLAQITALRGAIEAYQQTYGAYPGPIPDVFMFQVAPGSPPLPTGISPTGPGSHMTGTENLVLALLGGLSNVNGVITYNPADVGTGPRSLNPASPGQHAPFLNETRQLTKGFFSDNVDSAGQSVYPCFDSSVPEFVDKFSEPLPILYLRAKKGAPGVVSDTKYFNAGSPGSPVFQYDVRQYYGYIADCKTEPPASALSLYGIPQGWGSNKEIGLFQVASSDGTARTIGDPQQGGTGDPLINAKGKPNFAAAYFRHPTLTPANAIQGGVPDGTPRSKDEFILISAGPDRIFGTADDLTTFGSVIP